MSSCPEDAVCRLSLYIDEKRDWFTRATLEDKEVSVVG